MQLLLDLIPAKLPMPFAADSAVVLSMQLTPRYRSVIATLATSKQAPPRLAAQTNINAADDDAEHGWEVGLELKVELLAAE